MGVLGATSTPLAEWLLGHLSRESVDLDEGEWVIFASSSAELTIWIFAYHIMGRSVLCLGLLSPNQPMVWAVLASLVMATIAFVVPGDRNLPVVGPPSTWEWVGVAAPA